MKNLYAAFFALALVLTGIGFTEKPQNYYHRHLAEFNPPSDVSASFPDAQTDAFTLAQNDPEASGANEQDSDSDLKITQQLRQTIAQDAALSGSMNSIKISTENGIVTLEGEVRSLEEKETIGSKAKAIQGVSGIHNQLKVQGS